MINALFFSSLSLWLYFLPASVDTSQVDSSQNKELVWADEFNYTGSPDTSKWDFERGYIRNKELQFYTDRKENVRVENGNLLIEARNDSIQVGGETHPVSSSSIRTKGKAEWQYGKIEVRAKLPSSLGTWPAIWMLGTNIDEVGWPDCGEIDIMEHVGYDPHKIHANVHTKAYNHSIGTNKGQATEIRHPEEDFHVYAVDWNKEKIDFFIDEEKVFTFENEGKGTAEWPFDQPFYLILNLAIGGAWGGEKGVDLSTLPQQYYIDYVRVYQ